MSSFNNIKRKGDLMNKSNQRRMGVILSYISIIVESLTTLLYTPFLIRMIGQAEYGLYSLAATTIGYLSVLDFGLGNALIVYTAKYNAQKRYRELERIHGMFFILFSIIGFITGVLGFILFLNVNVLFGSTMNTMELYKAKIMMLILTFNLMVSFPLGTYTSIVRAHEKFVLVKSLSILRTILNPILMIPLLLLGYKSIAMSIILSVLNIVSLLVGYFYCKYKLNVKIKYSGFDFSIFKGIVGYSFFVFLGSIVDKVNWSVPQFVLGAVSGTIAVSIYSVANRLNSMFIYLSTALSGVLLPKVSSMVANNTDDSNFVDDFIKVGRLQFYIIFLIVSGLVLFGKEFIIIWVGKEFISSYYVTLLLVIPLSFYLIQNYALNVAQAKGKYNFIAIASSITAVFNLIFGYILAKRYGAIGSAFSTAISLIVCNVVILNIYYHKKLNLNVIKFWKSIIRMIVPCIIPVIFSCVFMNFYALKGIVSLMIHILVYTLCYCVVSYVLIMNDYEKNLVTNIINKFH